MFFASLFLFYFCLKVFRRRLLVSDKSVKYRPSMWTAFTYHKQRTAWCFIYIMLAMCVSKGLHFHEGHHLQHALHIEHVDARYTTQHTFQSAKEHAAHKAVLDHTCEICSQLIILLQTPIQGVYWISQAPLLERVLLTPLFIFLKAVDAFTVRGPPCCTEYSF